jgi:hypothetical protein
VDLIESAMDKLSVIRLTNEDAVDNCCGAEGDNFMICCGEASDSDEWSAADRVSAVITAAVMLSVFTECLSSCSSNKSERRSVDKEVPAVAEQFSSESDGRC